MRVDQIIAVAAEHLVGRLLRRMGVAAVVAVCTIVAAWQFTVAGESAIGERYGANGAHLIIGAIYAALALTSLIIFWALGRRSSRSAATPALSNPREMQLAMLVEAVMLGYALARKRERAS